MENYNGFQLERIKFNGRELIIVHPNKANGKWAIKTEYFDAFPDVQIKLLEMGYYVVHLKNITRWHDPSDTDARAELAEYMHKTYNVSKKCVIIGMSCGGMQGIYFASKYPEYVSVLYLDAPVVNFLSCPFNIGMNHERDFLAVQKEFLTDRHMTMSDVIAFRDHPLDNLDKLVAHKIPVILVAGDSDHVVPYEENGKFLEDAYIKNNCIIETIIKKGCEHHPHSLEDNTPIIEFIKKYDV